MNHPDSRTTTLVFEVPKRRRTDQERVTEIIQLVNDAIRQRREVLKEEAKGIVGALKESAEGRGPGNLHSARWYRTCSQLDMLVPLANLVTTALTDSSRKPKSRLAEVQYHLENALQITMVALCNEAMTISNDMEALALRIADEGHRAELRDIKSARWYCTASQMVLLKKIHDAFHAITETPAMVVTLPPAEDQDLETVIAEQEQIDD